MAFRSKLSRQVLLIISFYYFLLQISTTTPVLARNSKSNVTDRLALLSFKSLVTAGDALASWNDSSGICEWFGVGCRAVRHPDRVTHLNLDSLELNGIMSPYLSNLSFLQMLSLGDNEIHGVIPHELGNLPRLRYLNLSANSLEGEIPMSLGRCRQLQIMSLDGNNLGGEIPANLSRASNLQLLILKNNNLTGKIPPELGSLRNLIMLTLRKNQLTGTIPPSLGNMSSLSYLALADNNLEGSIPPELSMNHNLMILDLTFNRFSGELHPSLFNFSELSSFAVGRNLLTGSLPSDFGQYLPKLVYLYLHDNQFRGTIPISLANASMLESINLSNNSFTGLVPSNFGRLENLTSVLLGRNFLRATGEEDWSFVDSLTNCSLLEELDLSGNNFTGVLPNSIANLSPTMEWLRLRDNQIMGPIPAGIGKISSLVVLNMENNQFSGSIPETIGNLRKLQTLSITSNNFSGQIPTSIGNLTEMLELYMGGNRLTDTIPAELTSLKKLLVMDLGRNNLSGLIPKGFLELPAMTLFLNISHNSLTGPLPDEVGSLANLKALDVSVNKFSGEIPHSIGKCSILEYLNLGDNGFVGTIPESVGNLKGLLILDVSINQLSGRIPDFLEKMRTLQFLNLSFNDFEGEVPSEGVFSNVSRFSIEGNKNLCGGISNLNLRPCSTTKKNPTLSKPLVAVIAVAGVLLFLLFFFFLVYKFGTRNPTPDVQSDEEFIWLEDNDQFLIKLSYAELKKATNDFSSSNLIGSGGFGNVYKGTIFHGKKSKKIAVKVLNETTRAISKSFKAECKVLRHVRHRNLVRVLTSCTTVDVNGNEFKALVYEYMSKGSLENWLHNDRRGDLSLLCRLDIAINVASALDYLHVQTEESIVHCDLKPSNVLLDDEMVGRVSDFGIAKFVVNDDQTITTGIQGTIGYIAPECGMGSRLSTLWDVYSYGVLLLQMFTGKSPTDESLSEDGTTLHGYVEARFPDRIMDVVDPQLLLKQQQQQDDGVVALIRDALVAVMKIGLVCSKDSPTERMQMEDVVKELERIKEIVAKTQTKDETSDLESIAVHSGKGNSSTGWNVKYDSLADGR